MPDTIVVENLGKRFARYHGDRPHTLKQAVLQGLRGITPAARFWALREISFTVAPGKMVGMIGANGAGKSTLLRLIGGVGRPNEGGVTVNGRIGALLDLGANFHGELTGRENVFVSGVIAGLTRREVARRFDDIVAFAELEQFIDNPVRTYSTGMGMRLAFAVAVHTEPEVLLVDEVLAVGDLAFQRKCYSKIAQFRDNGCAIILVSHDPGQIQRMCDEVLWLRGGRLIAHGATEVVVGQYTAEMMAETRRRTPAERPALRAPSGAELRVGDNRFGSLDLEITAARLIGPGGRPAMEIMSGTPLRVEIEYHAPQPLPAPIFGVSISTEDGIVCCDLSTAADGIALPTVSGHGRIALQFERLDLSGGSYFVDVGAYAPDWEYAYDYHWHAYPLLVRQTSTIGKGALRPPAHWEMEAATSPGLERPG